MSQNILLSVIVPIYNTAPWLRRCLDSICSQSYHHLEILCVDDGSTDNSAEILAEYARRDSRIKVFTQKNAGLSAARNTGLENATGEWVTGVDSDDWLYPGIYEQAVKSISASVDIVFFGVQYVNVMGEPLTHGHYFDLPEAGEYPMESDVAGKLNVCFWSKLWRRSLLEENHLRFPVGLVHEDEAMFCLAAPYARNIAICPTVGYAYTQRENSIMHEDGLDALNRGMRYIPIIEYVCAEYEKRDLLHTSARKYLRKLLKFICAILYVFRHNNRTSPALKNVLSIVLKCGMLEDDYVIERIQACTHKGMITINRYQRAKVYRICGIPFWVKLYSYSGQPATLRLLLTHLKARFERLMGRK